MKRYFADERDERGEISETDVLASLPEGSFDRITTLTARLFAVPMAVICLENEDGVWFKSSVGLDPRNPQGTGFCSGDPRIRFHASAPLRSRDGIHVGALSIFDTEPRRPLTADEEATLSDLAAIVVAELESSFSARELRNTNARFERTIALQRAILNASEYLVLLTDPNGIIRTSNVAVENMLGYTAEALRGTEITLLFDAAEIQARSYSSDDQDVMEPDSDFGRLTLLARRGLQDVQEWQLIDKAGNRRPAQISIAPVRQPGGAGSGFLFIGHDIIRRNQAQEERGKFISLVQNSSDFIGMCAVNGEMLFLNSEGRQMVGIAGDADIAELSVYDFVTNRTVRALRRRLILALTREGHWSGELQFRHFQTGELVDIQMNAFVLKHPRSDELMCFAAICRDITARKQVERDLQLAKETAEAATRAKSRFLANMSHEIRTPINAVIGMTGLLLASELTAEQRDYIETIRLSGDALLMVINDILDFSKIESGKLDLENAPFSLRDCIEDTFDLLAGRAAEKGIELSYSIEGGTPAQVIGDMGRLRQILVNLVGNAIKFTLTGEVFVKAGAVAAKDGLWDIEIAVIDTGIGIPEDRLEALFDSFSQVDPSTTRKFGGTGLGLAISRRLAELMNGTIRVKSDYGEGSTFYVQIRCGAVEAGDVPARNDSAAAGKKILIAGSSWGTLFALTSLLKSSGAKTLLAETAGEAMDIAIEAIPDVAIVDVSAPAVSLDLLRKLSSIPCRNIILLHPLGWKKDEFLEGQTPENALSSAVCLISKPVKSSTLFDAISSPGTGRGTAANTRRRSEAIPRNLAEQFPLRILVAEDYAVNQKVALLLLSQLGYSADVASDGKEAIDALRRQAYDVVLMDMQMPVMDGLEATRRIRKLWPRPAGPRIIAMTANVAAADREECLMAGMDDFISKPVQMTELASALQRCRPAAAAVGASTRSGGPRGGDAAIWTLPQHLAELAAQGGSDCIAELLDLFLTDTPPRLRRLRQSIESRDAAATCSEAHGMKGSCAQVGALTMSKIAAQAEASAASNDWGVCLELAKNLEQDFDRVHAAIRCAAMSPPLQPAG